MNFSAISVIGGVLLAATVDAACPGSPAAVHAKCKMKITFPSASCATVQEEIIHRMKGDFGWTDPHNDGIYTLQDSNEETLKGSRLTGDKKYTDLFEMTFSSSSNNQKGGDYCLVEACSESQVTSVIDFSTNYCNLHVLYCSSAENCPIAKYDLEYEEDYSTCRQRDATKCLPSNSEDTTVLVN